MYAVQWSLVNPGKSAFGLIFCFDTRSCSDYYGSLMQDRLPERVAPFRLAETGRRLSGEMPAGKLKRLADLLFSQDTAIRVTLEFDKDDGGVHVASGTLAGELSLTCQRCLGLLRYPIDIRFSVVMARGPDEAERLPAGLDPLIIEDETLSIAELVEDEILLKLPIVPMHTASDSHGTCAPGSADRLEETGNASQNPFSVLAEFKKRN